MFRMYSFLFFSSFDGRRKFVVEILKGKVRDLNHCWFDQTRLNWIATKWQLLICDMILLLSCDVDVSYFQYSLVRTSKKEHDPYHPTINITNLFFTYVMLVIFTLNLERLLNWYMLLFRIFETWSDDKLVFVWIFGPQLLKAFSVCGMAWEKWRYDWCRIRYKYSKN